MKFLLNTPFVPVPVTHCSLEAFPRAEDQGRTAHRPVLCARWWEGWARSTLRSWDADGCWGKSGSWASDLKYTFCCFLAVWLWANYWFLGASVSPHKIMRLIIILRS